jgi:V8-like Glu-specific endopeptidase
MLREDELETEVEYELELEGEEEGEFEDEFEEELEFELIGADDRVRVTPAQRNPSTWLFPFNAICYLELRHQGTFVPWGTGNLVAPRVVLTAGHVLREAGLGPLRVTPGAARDAARPSDRSAGQPQSQRVAAGRFRTPANYVACSATDFGIILLPRAFARPNRFMPLQARAASRSAVKATIAGFPGDLNSAQPGTMWRHSEGIETVATTDGLLRHRIDTYPGSSGSPIWLLGAGTTRIQIGVHIGGLGCDAAGTRNVGARITNAMLAEIARWSSAARVRPPVMWRSNP